MNSISVYGCMNILGMPQFNIPAATIALAYGQRSGTNCQYDLIFNGGTMCIRWRLLISYNDLVRPEGPPSWPFSSCLIEPDRMILRGVVNVFIIDTRRKQERPEKACQD